MTLHHTPWPDRAIADLAGRQAANISHAQLRALDVPGASINAAVRRGRLHAVHVGVYSLVPPRARPALAAEHAAILACGPKAVLSHATAAALHGHSLPRRRPGAPVEVTIVAGDRARLRPGITVHRTRALGRGERVRVAGLPVTSVARTVVDLAPTLPDAGLEQLVDEALRRTSRAKLRDVAGRRRGRPGVARVLALLDPHRPSAEAWSRQERVLRDELIDASVPAAEANHPIGPYVADLAWPEFHTVVEYDSDRFHSSDRARHRDMKRHNDLQSWGWSVLHVTWPQLHEHRGRVLVWVALQLTRNGWTGP